MSHPFAQLAGPSNLWQSFYDLTQIPRPSTKEEKVRAYIIDLAEKNSWPYSSDKAGNIVVKKPGTPGKENNPPLLIQNHLDMVCDQTPGRNIDFETDPLRPYVDGEWIRAEGTTLGADNGIGCAAALALLLDKDIAHPPLEILFTVDEETGLHGALNLDPTPITAKRMLNLDSEEWGILYVGCAGGHEIEMEGRFELKAASFGKRPYILEIGNLRGGHSGVEIHLQQANAGKLLMEILHQSKPLDLEVSAIKVGKAHNIIPREGQIEFYMDPGQEEQFQSICEKALARWLKLLPKDDHQIEVNLTESTNPAKLVLKKEELEKVLSFIYLIPHGAHKFHRELDAGLVSLSSNLAKILLNDGKLWVLNSIRFFEQEDTVALDMQYERLGQSFSMSFERTHGYPGWIPNFDGDLVEIVKRKYKDQFNVNAQVTAIHAGLECGIIKDKLGEMDCVSFGPTITGAHTPNERVHIPSVIDFWELFKGILAEL